MSPQLNLCHSAMGARRIRWIFARSTLTRSRVLWRVSPTQAMQLVVAAGAGARSFDRAYRPSRPSGGDASGRVPGRDPGMGAVAGLCRRRPRSDPGEVRSAYEAAQSKGARRR